MPTKKQTDTPPELKRILESKGFWDKVVLDELDKRIVGERKSREIIFLCGMGRLVKNCSYTSFNLLMHSESSAGKDYITKNILKILPSSYIFSRTRISPTVLNYWKPFKKIGQDSWNGCVLYLPDISESVLNSDAMKLICSEGSHITITDKGEARDIEIKGKPVIFSTTATTTPNEEILNRFSIVHLDESEEQTKKIMIMQGERMVEGLSLDYDENIRKSLNYLIRYKVKIPFAKKVVKVFPSKKIGERRNFERFFDFIKSITCFHQYQREIEGDYLIAEIEDYDKAKDIFMNLQRGVSTIPLNVRQKDIINVLKNQEEMLALNEIHKKLRRYIALSNLRPHLESLVNIKVIERYYDSDKMGREILKYKLSEEYLDFKPIILPNGIDLLYGNGSSSSSSSNGSNGGKII